MARKNFTVTIQGSATHTRHQPSPDSFTGNVIAQYATESSLGTTRRKPKGWIPPTPYSFDRTVYEAGHGTVKRRTFYTSSNTTYGRSTFSGRLGTNSTYGASFLTPTEVISVGERIPTSSMRDRALILARSKMRSGDVNLGVAFAERSRTATLCGDTAIQLVKSLRALRKGDWRKAARELGITNPRKPRGSTIPQKWLELQYGWKPLLSDVYGSAEALTRQPRQNWRVTGKGVIKEKIDRRKLRESLSDRWEIQASGWRGVHARIDAIPENDLLMSLSNLGVTNPLLIGWELVPFSFVIDWFLPIGAYLESLDAMLGYGESWYCESSFSRCKISYAWAPGRFDGTQNRSAEYSGSCSPRLDEIIHLNRKVTKGVPLPTMPRFKDGRSLGHMANALSLLATVFGGKSAARYR